MIVFDLKCGQGHVFEAWFGSSDAYEQQRCARQIHCPICNDDEIVKALMAPAIPSKGNRKAATPSPDTIKSMMKMLATQQAKALESSQWVGPAFADRARAIHLGEERQTRIHGQASLAEARALVEEGVSVAALPLPVVPPGEVN